MNCTLSWFVFIPHKSFVTLLHLQVHSRELVNSRLYFPRCICYVNVRCLLTVLSLPTAAISVVAQEDEDEEEDDEAAGDADDEEGMDTVHTPYQLGHCGASMSKKYLEKGVVSAVCQMHLCM